MKRLLLLFAIIIPRLSGAVDDEVTFNRDVAPILYRHCAECHRPGQIGPFPLVTYKDAARRSRQIATLTGRGQMPPWHAVQGDFALKDERRLSKEEIETLARWSESGRVEGDPKDLPPPPEFPSGWLRGEPDLILELPEVEIPADGEDVFVDAVVEIPVDEQRWLSCVALLPGNPTVVHHAGIHVDRIGSLSKWRGNPQRSDGVMPVLPEEIPLDIFLGFLPGTKPHKMPDGFGVPVTGGANVLVRFHYHPTGKPEKDQSKIGLYFDDNATRETFLLNFGIFKQGQPESHLLDIPAGKKDHKIRFSSILPVGGRIHTIQPHGHFLMRDYDLVAHPPGGEASTVLSIRDWDFNWQDRYEFAEPPPFPRGTKFEIVAVFDNSADNPQNPSDPPIPVRAGPQSNDEMCGVWVYVIPKNREFVQIPEGGLPYPEIANRVKKYDLDKDGRLSEAEFADAPERMKLLLTAAATDRAVSPPDAAADSPANGAPFRIPDGGIAIPAQMSKVKERLDKNRDGRLTEQELTLAPDAIQTRIRDFFKNRDAETDAPHPASKPTKGSD